MGRDKRVHIRSAFIGGLVAALTVMALPAVAAEVAAALQLGQSNTAHARTTLTGSVRSANLLIVNTHPGGSPLSLVSRPGEPPLKVNRVAKVRNLNADRVDGLSAHQLVRVAHAATNNVDEAIFGGGSDADVLTVTVKAPRAGFLRSAMHSTTSGAASPSTTPSLPEPSWGREFIRPAGTTPSTAKRTAHRPVSSLSPRGPTPLTSRSSAGTPCSSPVRRCGQCTCPSTVRGSDRRSR